MPCTDVQSCSIAVRGRPGAERANQIPVVSDNTSTLDEAAPEAFVCGVTGMAEWFAGGQNVSLGVNRMNIVSPWEKAISELAEWVQLRDGSVVPFVGAGVSRQVGVPTWSELADRILGSCIGLEAIS